jgi:hypothetical protein
LYAAGFCRAWLLAGGRVTMVATSIAIIAALAAAFGAIPVYATRLPHPEMAIPAFALWFFIAVSQQAWRAAAVWLALCLLVREDAGLHIFAVLALWIGVLIAREGWGAPRIEFLAVCALLTLTYAAVAFLVKHIWFPGSDALFRVYLGTPLLGHITAPFLLDRLRLYLTERTFVWLPMLITILWAWIRRDPLLSIGLIATLPWLVFSFLAVHSSPGGVAYYYGFPFWLSLAWPLVALSMREATDRRMRALWPMSLLLVVSLAGWDHGRFVVYPLQRDYLGETPFAWNEFTRDGARSQDFADWFVAHRGMLGGVMLDQAVGGLLIAEVNRAVWSETWNGRLPDAMIYFRYAYEWPSKIQPRLRTGAYVCVYSVPGTRIEVAMQRPVGDHVAGTLVPIINAPGVEC